MAARVPEYTGASDYLCKPVDLDQLAAKLEHWLRDDGTQKEAQA
jgi:DNA-binding response OmpR family regulator